jgi:uncharacterized YccA/Bax inhibitor family protein
MTVNGVIRKSFIALFLLLASAAYAWTRPYASGQEIFGKIALFSVISLVLNFVIIFNHNTARITVPLFALAEGFVIGAFSLMMQRRSPGIVVQAVTGTFGVFAAMLCIYKTGIIRPTEKFMIIISAAMLGIFFVYLANFIMVTCGSSGFSIVNGSSNLSIGFSVFVCIIAALNLIINFEFIVRHSKLGAPEKMEWIAAFGLLVTLIWIYLEILNLLRKLNCKRD